jgi:Cu(I)/Ag(I) efflux system membrane protein CusA/SilA
MIAAYRPLIHWVLAKKKTTLVIAAGVLALSLYPALKLGSEFMPTLNEGTLFYMPTALPGLSVTKAAELLQTQNKIIKSFPEVASVYGKAGRAQTATDPAPLEMFETVINLKPQEEWRAGMNTDKLIAEMDKALQFPGVANSWTMPIKARIDMLSTGIRTPIGIKVFGKDLNEMERLARQIESVVKQIPGTSSAYAERITGGFYLDIEPDRLALARYGLSVGELQDVIATALGGEMVTTTVEGLERFGVNVRYPRELRDSPERIAREVLVSTMDGAMIPLGQIAKVSISKGAPSIRTENALLSAYIYVDIRERDIGSYVAEARQAVNEQVSFPPGYYATWSGQFEYMERAIAKMKIVIPITLLLIFLLLYLNFRRVTESLVVMLSVPFALVGGVWLLWLLDYNLSVAVAVGFIALAGVAAETGVVMLIYLEKAWQDKLAECASRLPQQHYSSPFKGEAGRGMGESLVHSTTHPRPNPPLEGEGTNAGGDNHPAFPHPNPDGTTSHSTKPASGQVAGYPPEGEGANAARLPSHADLYAAIMHGAVERVRPKMMTVVAIMAGLLPILWSSGTGSEVMRRIAAPMVGGMISSAVLTLLVIPVIYALIKQRQLSSTASSH